MRNGKGIKSWVNGSVYQGDYKNDKKNGFGVETQKTGEKYEG